MNIDEFMSDFEIHAKSELFNGDEISGEVLDEIRKQLTDAVGEKNPPRWAVMEFAMYRVKKMLKIAVSEDEWLLFEKALKAIASAKDDEGSDGGFASYKFAAV